MISTSELSERLTIFDQAIDDAFTSLRGKPLADKIFYLASEGADFSAAWHVIGIITAISNPTLRTQSVRLALTLGIESLLVNGLIKELTNRPRPELLDDRSHEVRRPKTSSFPSGHASSAAVTAVLMSAAVPKLKPVWVGMAAVVGASRIHNRMHFGSDVAAGAVIGTAIAIAAKRIWKL